MTRIGTNGHPVGTVCELVQSAYADYLYEPCEIVSGRKWHAGSGCYTYEIHMFKRNRWFVVAETQLKLISYPPAWENWLRNKIERLLVEIPLSVRQDIELEKIRGTR